MLAHQCSVRAAGVVLAAPWQAQTVKHHMAADGDFHLSPGAGAAAAAGPGEDTASSSSGRKRVLIDPVAARQAAAVVTSSAADEVSSPFRMYLFGYMATVLALVVLQGAQGLTLGACRSSTLHNLHPKYALDGMYAMLGLLLGLTWSMERRALTRVLQDKQQQVHQLQQQQDAAAAAAGNDGSAVGSSSAEQ
ncbi:hypothetical protein COO60DRAFT_1524440 [Scenedesmus sp. NREL 46B-D3]|nr:hypothetical protein COO60DRAFT_1524440 [Scenedesmus sp. NREL 46B-D3]